MDDLVASGVLQITDTATGTTLLPGCCNELDERRNWLEVVDGNGWAFFGHDPSPLAERHSEVVRLNVGRPTCLAASGQDQRPFLTRRLLATAVLFLASGAGYALRRWWARRR
jgi:hypothetical protein